MSALLGRIPSAVGYQPTLATDMGTMQERITTTKKGSITSVQAIYVPADDLTDPAPATTFAHLVMPPRFHNLILPFSSIKTLANKGCNSFFFLQSTFAHLVMNGCGLRSHLQFYFVLSFPIQKLPAQLIMFF